jgi:poly(beta-D-mannuronate) lyase
MRSSLPAVLLILSASHGVNAAEKPSDVLDLSRWKLTLPYARPGNKSPIEILQPELDEFENPKCFFVDKSGKGDKPGSYGEVVIYRLKVEHMTEKTH